MGVGGMVLGLPLQATSGSALRPQAAISVQIPNSSSEPPRLEFFPELMLDASIARGFIGFACHARSRARIRLNVSRSICPKLHLPHTLPPSASRTFLIVHCNG